MSSNPLALFIVQNKAEIFRCAEIPEGMAQKPGVTHLTSEMLERIIRVARVMFAKKFVERKAAWELSDQLLAWDSVLKEASVLKAAEMRSRVEATATKLEDALRKCQADQTEKKTRIEAPDLSGSRQVWGQIADTQALVMEGKP